MQTFAMVLPRCSTKPATVSNGRYSTTGEANMPTARKLHAKKVLRYGSDFSGMEAPMLALRTLGVNVKHVFASDINKHCKKLILNMGSPAIFYDSIQDRKPEATPPVDFYMFGAPCQPFSISGKGFGSKDHGFVTL